MTDQSLATLAITSLEGVDHKNKMIIIDPRDPTAFTVACQHSPKTFSFISTLGNTAGVEADDLKTAYFIATSNKLYFDALENLSAAFVKTQYQPNAVYAGSNLEQAVKDFKKCVELSCELVLGRKYQDYNDMMELFQNLYSAQQVVNCFSVQQVVNRFFIVAGWIYSIRDDAPMGNILGIFQNALGFTGYQQPSFPGAFGPGINPGNFAGSPFPMPGQQAFINGAGHPSNGTPRQVPNPSNLQTNNSI